MTPTSQALTITKSVGRPPDPEVEPRVLSAVIDVYSEVGWAGFTIDAVVRRSKVGKAALYARWRDKADLLSSALHSINIEPAIVDTGTIRDDLIGIATMELNMWGGKYGQAHRRIEVDSVYYPEVLGPIREAFRQTAIYAGREIIQRAITRGELQEGVSAGLILDALNGSVQHRLSFLPDDRREDFEKRKAGYIESLVDFILAAAASPHGGSRVRRC